MNHEAYIQQRMWKRPNFYFANPNPYLHPVLYMPLEPTSFHSHTPAKSLHFDFPCQSFSFSHNFLYTQLTFSPSRFLPSRFLPSMFWAVASVGAFSSMFLRLR